MDYRQSNELVFMLPSRTIGFACIKKLGIKNAKEQVSALMNYKFLQQQISCCLFEKYLYIQTRKESLLTKITKSIIKVRMSRWWSVKYWCLIYGMLTSWFQMLCHSPINLAASKSWLWLESYVGEMLAGCLAIKHAALPHKKHNQNVLTVNIQISL